MSTRRELSIYDGVTEDSITQLSFIWSVSREDDDFETTLAQYVEAMRSTDTQLQLIVVQNGLPAQVVHQLHHLLREYDINSTVVQFGSACPESTALAAAFGQATGDVIVLLPSYPQADPRDILRMLDAVRAGRDYVASWRTPRIDGPLDQFKSRAFNWLTRLLSGIELHDINSGLRMMRREVVQDLPLYGDLHIYLPILAAKQGFTVGEVPVRHLEERPSASGHGAGVYSRRTLDLLSLFFLTRFTQKPFRFFGGIGGALLLVGGVVNGSLAFQKLFFGAELANRPLLVLATLLMVLGIQMFSLGLIGELIIFVSAGGFSEYGVQQIYEQEPRKEQTAPDQPERA